MNLRVLIFTIFTISSLEISLQTDTPRYQVSENSPVGTEITPITNLFPDWHYNQNAIVSNPLFAVENGYIVSKGNLDREDSTICEIKQKNDFECIVEVSVVRPLPVDSKFIQIHITDENDHPPTFSQEIQDIVIPENIQPLESPKSLELAKDDDSPPYSIQHYFLESLEPDVDIRDLFGLKFTTRSDGVQIPKLNILSELDHEVKSNYMLNLIAQDPMYTGSMKINITLIDINDCSPSFEQSEQSVAIAENAQIGSIVLQVTALDADSGDNGLVTYRFAEETLPEIEEFFSIGEKTGEIRLIKSLKSQGGQTYSVQIEARDSARHSLSDLMTTSFVITDVNDFAPEFTFIGFNSWNIDGRNYYFSENEEPRDIGFFTVSDNDPGAFGEVELRQVDGFEYFELSPLGAKSSSLRTLQKLDREVRSEVNVTFVAFDCAKATERELGVSCDRLNKTRVITFHVGDINDNDPRFEQHQPYQLTLREEEPPAHLLTLSAIDPDLGPNGTVRYSIPSLGHRAWFEVGAVSGELHSVRRLDREVLGDRFTLRIKASDQGNPNRFADKEVHVTLLDINDNLPKFNETSYVFHLSESTEVGGTVGRLAAHDPDANSCIEYEVMYPGTDDFRLDSRLGHIKTRRSFDYEDTTQRKEFYFQVKARECGDASRYATVGVNIKLVDDNDNSPTIISPAPDEETEIPWDADAFYQICRVQAIDLDSGPENSALSFSLQQQQHLFALLDDVIVLNHRSEKERERDGRYALWVVVRDGGQRGQERHEVKRQHFVRFSGNWTLYNHTEGGRMEEGAGGEPFPRVMVYAISTIGAIVILIIIIWLFLILRLRNSDPRRVNKTEYNMVAGENQIQLAPNPTLRSLSPGQASHGIRADQSSMDNIPFSAPPYLTTFNESPLENEVGYHQALTLDAGGVSSPTHPYRSCHSSPDDQLAAGSSGTGSDFSSVTPSKSPTSRRDLDPATTLPGRSYGTTFQPSRSGDPNATSDSPRRTDSDGILKPAPGRGGTLGRRPPSPKYANYKDCGDCWAPRSPYPPHSPPPPNPVVPPRPSDPDHPRNSGILIRPNHQILSPPHNGHEKWNLPTDNTFRGGKSRHSRGDLDGYNHPEAPDLCKDVKNSLERNNRSLSKNRTPKRTVFIDTSMAADV